MHRAGVPQSAQLDLSKGVKQALEQAAAIAARRGEKGIASAHLLHGALVDDAIVSLLMRIGTI